MFAALYCVLATKNFDFFEIKLAIFCESCHDHNLKLKSNLIFLLMILLILEFYYSQTDLLFCLQNYKNQ